MITARVLASCAAVAVLATSGTAAAATGAPSGSDSSGLVMSTEARFSPPNAAGHSKAITYNQKGIPAGAWVKVSQYEKDGGTLIELQVKGVEPNHIFGAHIHVNPCGADPKAAGGHYQNNKAPDMNSMMDEKYANPANEVWLDFRSDSKGDATAFSWHKFGFRAGEANSVVIHAVPGLHGDRWGCVTVPFKPTGKSDTSTDHKSSATDHKSGTSANHG